MSCLSEILKLILLVFWIFLVSFFNSKQKRQPMSTGEPAQLKNNTTEIYSKKAKFQPDGMGQR